MFQVRHAKRNISRAEQEEIVALNRFKLAVVALDFGFTHVSKYTGYSRVVNWNLAGFFELSTVSSTQAIDLSRKRQGGRFLFAYR